MMLFVYASEIITKLVVAKSIVLKNLINFVLFLKKCIMEILLRPVTQVTALI